MLTVIAVLYAALHPSCTCLLGCHPVFLYRLARADCRTSEDDPHLWTSHVVSRSYRAPELFMARSLTDDVSPPTSPRQSYTDPSPTSVFPDSIPRAGGPFAPCPAYSCYSSAIDIWSVGAVFAEALTGRTLFPRRSSLRDHLRALLCFSGTPKGSDWYEAGGNASQSMRSYLSSLDVFPGIDKKAAFPGVSTEGARLLDALLAFDPNDRPTAAQALQSPYFDSVRAEYDHFHQMVPPPVRLNALDFAFELRRPIENEAELLRQEILDEIRVFRDRNNLGPWPSAPMPPAERQTYQSSLAWVPTSASGAVPKAPTGNALPPEPDDYGLGRSNANLDGGPIAEMQGMRLDDDEPAPPSVG